MVYLHTDGRPSKYLAGSAWPEVELITVDYKTDALTITLPSYSLPY